MEMKIDKPRALQERYKLLPPELTELFDYGIVKGVIEKIANEHNLSEEKVSLLKMEVEMTLCLFLPRRGITKRIENSLELNQEEAVTITSKLEEGLFSLVDPILSFVDEHFFASREEETQKELDHDAYIDSKNDSENSQSTLVKPLRTMDSDAKNIHGYGAFGAPAEDDEPVHSSSQESVMKKEDSGDNNPSTPANN